MPAATLTAMHATSQINRVSQRLSPMQNISCRHDAEFSPAAANDDTGLDNTGQDNISRAPLRGLRRIQPGQGHGGKGGWAVCLIRLGVRYFSEFMEINYGGEERAKSAALAFHAALLARLPNIFSQQGDDGLPGTVRRTNSKTPCWVAFLWREASVNRKSFAVGKYGEAEAQRLAEAALLGWRKEFGFDQRPVLPSKTEIAELLQTIRERYHFKSGLQGFTDYHGEDRYAITRRREANASGKGGSWAVRLRRRKVTYRQDFSDSAYGGREKALVAARRYRDEVLSTVKPLSRRERQTVVMKSNTSGVVGVLLVRSRGQAVAWRAQINLKGKAHVRDFNFRKYGAECAFELAVKARAAMVDALDGDLLHSPAAKKLARKQKA